MSTLNYGSAACGRIFNSRTCGINVRQRAVVLDRSHLLRVDVVIEMNQPLLPIVRAVKPNSPASEAGFRVGDIIEEVNSDAVTAVSDLKDAVSRPALVLVRRGDQSIYLTLSPRSE